MLSNFTTKQLAAFNSVRQQMPADFQVIVAALDEQLGLLDQKNRTCKDEITFRQHQGGQPVLMELSDALMNAGAVLRKEHDNQQERESAAAVRGRAIG